MEMFAGRDFWLLAYGMLATVIIGVMVWWIMRKPGSPYS